MKALPLAKKYCRHLHCCHVSLQEEVKLIKKVKEQGLRISAEVAPHHLFLTASDAKRLGSYGMMKPPLRQTRDIDALWKGIKDGTIDMVATDHAPHTKEEKESAKPAFGVPGLETALPLLLTAVKEKRLTLEKVIELYHVNPRRLFNLPKQLNTYIEVDMHDKWEIRNENLKTKCGWSPFDSCQVYGKIRRVVQGGRIAYRDGNVLVHQGSGQRAVL